MRMPPPSVIDGIEVAPSVVKAAETEILRNMDSITASNGNDFVLAWSGGKDSILASFFAKKYGIVSGVCETSFCFPRDVSDFAAIAKQMGLKITFKDSLSNEWLARHGEFIFPKMSEGAKFYLARQQSTVKKFALGHTGYITGRRTQENTVKGICYGTKNGLLTAHPLRNIPTHVVWMLIKHYSLPYPSIYDTPLGRQEGATPWCNINTSKTSRERCWQLVYEHDRDFFTNSIAKNFKEADQWLKRQNPNP